MSEVDPVAFFEEVAASHRRCFWLDGGGAREWSGRQSIIGWLEESDLSLSYDAASREVTRHVNGRADVVGHDVFAALDAELEAGDSSEQWFGYFGYAARPDRPATPGPMPDAIWMRAGHVRMFEHPPPTGVARLAAGAPRTSTTVGPRLCGGLCSRPGGAARRQLLRGQPHPSPRDPQRPLAHGGVPAAAPAQPRAVRRVPAARRRRRPGVAAAARRRSAMPWSPRTGRSRPSRSRAPRRAPPTPPRTRSTGAGWRRTRSTAPRT